MGNNQLLGGSSVFNYVRKPLVLLFLFPFVSLFLFPSPLRTQSALMGLYYPDHIYLGCPPTPLPMSPKLYLSSGLGLCSRMA